MRTLAILSGCTGWSVGQTGLIVDFVVRWLIYYQQTPLESNLISLIWKNLQCTEVQARLGLACIHMVHMYKDKRYSHLWEHAPKRTAHPPRHGWQTPLSYCVKVAENQFLHAACLLWQRTSLMSGSALVLDFCQLHWYCSCQVCWYWFHFWLNCLVMAGCMLEETQSSS